VRFSAAAGAYVGGVASAAAAKFSKVSSLLNLLCEITHQYLSDQSSDGGASRKFSKVSSLLNLLSEMTVQLTFENSAAAAGADVGGGGSVYV